MYLKRNYNDNIVVTINYLSSRCPQNISLLFPGQNEIFVVNLTIWLVMYFLAKYFLNLEKLQIACSINHCLIGTEGIH